MKLAKTATIILTASLFLTFAKSALADGAEVVCTPVYGMANSCAEHTVVDTSLDTSTLANASVTSYVLGLAAFIKAKQG